MKICPNTAVKTHPLLQNITALTLNIQHICIFLSQPEETQKYKKTYWLVKRSSRRNGINSRSDLSHHRTCRSAYGGSLINL